MRDDKFSLISGKVKYIQINDFTGYFMLMNIILFYMDVFHLISFFIIKKIEHGKGSYSNYHHQINSLTGSFSSYIYFSMLLFSMEFKIARLTL